MTMQTLKNVIAKAEEEANPRRTDHFVFVNTTALAFPCQLCIHGDKSLDDAPCLSCSHFNG